MAIQSVQVTINGVNTTLTLNSSTGKYEATLTAPSKSSYTLANKYYPVTVKATDSAGNSTTKTATDATLGSSLRLVVKETTAPVIAITSPTEGQKMSNSQPTITWTVTDDDSGVNAGTIGITIDSNTKVTSGITTTVITGGYQCSYAIPTALTDGTHTIKIDANDNDGNAAVQRTVNFVVDTVPPNLSVTSPTNNLVTKEKEITVSGTTNDATSNPVTLTVKLNNGTTQNVNVSDTGAFTTTLDLVEGVNTIVIVATDSAGKTSSITRTVTLDTGAPVITDIIITPNPASTGEIINVSATVTD